MLRPSSREGDRGVRGDESHSLNGILRMKNPFASADFFVRRTLFSERNLFPRVFASLTMGLLLAALPALAKTPPKPKPKAAPIETAMIENTGSTNTLGYSISVTSGGSITVVSTHTLPAPSTFPDTKKLFADLKAAMPLTSLPVRHGMRSASFGTQTFITYKGQRSPDLTFASDPRAAALKADVNVITKMLGVGNAPRHPIVIDKNGAITDGTQN